MTPKEYAKQKRGNRKRLALSGICKSLVDHMIAGRPVTIRVAIDAERITQGQISVHEIVVSDDDRARLDYMRGK